MTVDEYKSRYTEEEFEPFDKFLLPDNNKIREIKTIYQREEDYIFFLQPIESFFAHYFHEDKPELKDVDVKKTVRKIKSNLNRNPDFFETEFEKELMCIISFALKNSPKKITKHELHLILGYILWCIDNRKWLNDSRAYLNWLCNFFKIFNQEEKQRFDEFYKKIGKEHGKTEDEIRVLKNESPINQVEIPVLDIVLDTNDSAKFSKYNKESIDETTEGNNKEKMIDVKCSVCSKNMQMPMSFLKKIPDGNADSIPHVCSDCIDKVGNDLGDKKMKAFVEDVNKQMEKLGKNNEMAEKLAEEITNKNINSLMDELNDTDASEEDKIKESFYRGIWMTLFLMANNHEEGFLEKEAESIRDFHKKMKESEGDV